MLQHLSIRNFALIREAELDFPAGFSALTGETGAGKSMLLGAVAAALGSRVHREVLHPGATTVIDCSFQPGDAPAVERLAVELGCPEGNPMSLRREIGAKGRSRFKLNGRPVQQKDLRRLAPLLADFHGQRDLARLMDRERHAGLLDDLEYVRPARERHRRCWEDWNKIDERHRELKRRGDRRREQRELWEFQLAELAALEARADEDAELENEQRALSNVEELKRLGHDLAERLYEHEEGVYNRIAGAERELAEACRLDAELEEPLRMLREAQLQVEECGRLLAARADTLEWDPERLARVRERLELLDRMIRKYGGSLNELLRTREGLERKLAEGDSLDRELKEAGRELDELGAELREAEGELSRARDEGAGKLVAALEPLLEELGIQGGSFAVHMDKPASERDPVGLERPRFLISTNPDTPLGPLEQIASGGELSRIMLALKAVLLGHLSGRCLVFDEIDAGLSGRAAGAVSRLLRTLAAGHQLLCITHLPQIAAAADSHFGVEKRWDGSRTRIEVRLLEGEQRVRQIARLQAGVEEEPELEGARRLIQRQGPKNG